MHTSRTRDVLSAQMKQEGEGTTAYQLQGPVQGACRDEALAAASQNLAHATEDGLLHRHKDTCQTNSAVLKLLSQQEIMTRAPSCRPLQPSRPEQLDYTSLSGMRGCISSRPAWPKPANHRCCKQTAIGGGRLPKRLINLCLDLRCGCLTRGTVRRAGTAARRCYSRCTWMPSACCAPWLSCRAARRPLTS